MSAAAWVARDVGAPVEPQGRSLGLPGREPHALAWARGAVSARSASDVPAGDRAMG